VPELAVAPDLLQLAEHIVNSKVAAFNPMAFRDRYEEKAEAAAKQSSSDNSANLSPSSTPIATTSTAS